VIDHVGLEVDDYAASRTFYEMLLAPLGLEVVIEFGEATAGWGAEGGRAFFLINGRGRPATSGLHIAFAAPTRDAVDTFHAAGLAAGGSDNGAPGARPFYHPDYYGAFILDLHGNNVEAVCHTPAP
jgi:catechol 2,3-dioxygenase-like lactoylglutathione lyase family enzyme